jgi:hypothetical protein
MIDDVLCSCDEIWVTNLLTGSMSKTQANSKENFSSRKQSQPFLSAPGRFVMMDGHLCLL